MASRGLAWHTPAMRILILGGTGFVGRHLAERCLERGHQLSLFHRGRSNPGILRGAEHIAGDRDADLSALRGRTFDVVVDTGGYEVSAVRAAARAALHPDLHYVFISSLSVYSDLTSTDELSGPLRTIPDAETAKLSLETYGALKTACERALDEELDGRVEHVRAGLILGPHDYDERFRYWLTRVARGGEVLAPGDPEALTQAIDARDLAEWLLAGAEARVTGRFNVTGRPMTMRALLETIRDVVGGGARFTWVPDEILTAHAVGPYSEMPFWLPASLGARPVDIGRALARGLALRPFADTVRDTWTWMQTSWDAEASVRDNRRLRVPGGMSTEREAQILEAARRAAE
jgi:2'-hydroxyisoflavone reductase